jgi:hypothetical protein
MRKREKLTAKASLFAKERKRLAFTFSHFSCLKDKQCTTYRGYHLANMR